VGRINGIAGPINDDRRRLSGRNIGAAVTDAGERHHEP
jgi:hypothetical protein